MSAIAGIIHFDGKPVPVEDLESLTSAMSHRGPDGIRHWRRGNVGLAHLMFWTTRESLNEVLPLSDATGRTVLTADAWLTNRDELISKLDFDKHQASGSADSQLVLAAYEKWGPRGVEYLEGDFSCVLWDQRTQQLICWSDFGGKVPLYYYHDSGRFIFASEIKGILGVPGIPRELNEKKLARLAGPFGDLLDKEETYYKGINKFPPTTVTTVSARGKQEQRYYELDNPPIRLNLKSDDEYLEAIRELIFKAVEARLRSAFPLGALLSGGLDSSSIVSVAARQLEKRGQQLTTFSAVSQQEARESMPDEREYMEEFRDWPQLDMHFVTADGKGPFDDIERLMWGSDVPFVTSRHYLYTAFTAAAKERGIRTILEGVGGEFGPTTHAEGYLAELLLRGRWLTLIRETFAKSSIEDRSVWPIVRSEVIRPSLPLYWRRWLGARLGRDISVWQEMTMLKAEFIESHLGGNLRKMQQLASDQSEVLPDHRKNLKASIQALEGVMTSGGWVGYEQVNLLYPFADKKLIEFCLAVPGRLKIRNGYNRCLIRGALEGILPSSIQWRTTKKAFSPDFPFRYNRQRRWVEEWLNAISSHDSVSEVVNVKRLKSLATHEMTTHGNSPADFAAMHILPLGVYLIVFLRQFGPFKP